MKDVQGTHRHDLAFGPTDGGGRDGRPVHCPRQRSARDGPFSGFGKSWVLAFAISGFLAWLDEHVTVHRLRRLQLRLIIRGAHAHEGHETPMFLRIDITLSNLATPVCIDRRLVTCGYMAKRESAWTADADIQSSKPFIP